MSYPITKADTAVVGMINLNIQGDVIPPQWYKWLRNGKQPYWLAAQILAHVCYWYTPTVKRDERTGQVTGMAKKFKSDLLQRSYSELRELYGLGESQDKQIRRACKYLEDESYIKLVFRHIHSGKITLSNVMFVALNVQKVAEMTYRKVDHVDTSGETMWTPVGRWSGHEWGDGLDMSGETYTSITNTSTSNTENTFGSPNGDIQATPKCPQCGIGELQETNQEQCAFCLVREKYNEMFPKRPKITKRSKKVAKKVLARWKSKDFRAGWIVGLQKASASNFISTWNGFDLAWYVHNDENWRKCHDGKYDNLTNRASMGASASNSQRLDKHVMLSDLKRVVAKFGRTRYREAEADVAWFIQPLVREMGGWRWVCDMREKDFDPKFYVALSQIKDRSQLIKKEVSVNGG